MDWSDSEVYHGHGSHYQTTHSTDGGVPPDHRVEKEAISLSQNGHDVFLLCLRDKQDKTLRDYKGITLVSVYIPMIIIKKLRALTNTIFNFYPYLWFFLIRRFIKSG